MSEYAQCAHRQSVAKRVFLQNQISHVRSLNAEKESNLNH